MSHPSPANPERQRPRTTRPHAIRQAHRGPPSRGFQEAAVRRDLQRRGIDPETVDYKSEIDSKASLHQNIAHVRQVSGRSSRYAGASTSDLEERQRAFMEQQRAAKKSEYGVHYGAKKNPRDYEDKAYTEYPRKKSRLGYGDESHRGEVRESSGSGKIRVRRR